MWDRCRTDCQASGLRRWLGGAEKKSDTTCLGGFLDESGILLRLENSDVQCFE
jgi:hypothetical protein